MSDDVFEKCTCLGEDLTKRKGDLRKLTVDLVTGRELRQQTQKQCFSQEAFGKLIWPICQKVLSSISTGICPFVHGNSCHESSWLSYIRKIKCYSWSLVSSCRRERIEAVQVTKPCADFPFSFSAEVSRHGALQASSLGALAYSLCRGPVQDEPGLATQAEDFFVS